ncbi:hypothetical protein [Paenibacillus oleatilyticus]|uniref:hypothetical protein n=1 Tax=Paenibacillus oleatilyticus TaxID=2594886 RepID=UPI0035A73591
MRDTSKLIALACDGDLPDSYFRKKLTIGEVLHTYESQSQSNAIPDSETAE